MAIVAEGVAGNGAHYRIDDGMAAAQGTAEFRRRAEAQCRAAYQILRDWERTHRMNESEREVEEDVDH